MLGLTTLGVVHTALSLVAVVAAIAALVRYKEISPRQRIGQVYIVATILTCLTAFGIFQHGGFGPPHALGILTLIALGVAYAAGRGLLGRASRRVEIIAYTLTVFFHSVPGVTESLTRLPPGAPLVASQEAPIFPVIYGIFFVIFLIGVTLQVRWLAAHEPVPQALDETHRPA
jgi:uncharacterized membrane protein